MITFQATPVFVKFPCIDNISFMKYSRNIEKVNKLLVAAMDSRSGKMPLKLSLIDYLDII